MKLVTASKIGTLTIVENLIDQGLDINATDNNGWTALMHASYEGHLNVMKALLGAGANMDTKEPEHGFTALTLGILGSKYDVVQALLDAGADTEVTDKYGNTPLIRASQRDPYNVDINIVHALLNAGANKNAKNNGNETALDVANKNCNLDIVGILQK